MKIFKALAGVMLALTLPAAGSASAGTDPVGPDPKTGANFNRYAYANNNPYRFTDPDGRFSKPTGPLYLYEIQVEMQTKTGAIKVERGLATDYGQAPANGTVLLLPQRSANGAPAQVGDAVKGRLLNFSQKEAKTIEVTSGQRTVEQNRNVGGAPGSQHLQNNAADIRISGFTPNQTADAAQDSGEFNRVNEYSNGRGVHVDLKENGTQGRFYDWRPQREE